MNSTIKLFIELNQSIRKFQSEKKVLMFPFRKGFKTNQNFLDDLGLDSGLLAPPDLENNAMFPLAKSKKKQRPRIGISYFS